VFACDLTWWPSIVVWKQCCCGGAWKRRSDEGYECYVHEGICEGEVLMVGKRDGGSHGW